MLTFGSLDVNLECPQKALMVAAVRWGRICGLDERLMADIDVDGDCEEFAVVVVIKQAARILVYTPVKDGNDSKLLRQQTRHHLLLMKYHLRAKYRILSDVTRVD
ncbi:hypothetical protein DKX38_029609 [Salix brachista]|uniref:Uncharacterized protein n=1 Tax=Salix brachista TaxID=2182728 RepID=A0A5N5J059_9ROSI|nr:hypothetical protein DKX38_029609 [Salix brachista]